jgi:hypothetical protein
MSSSQADREPARPGILFHTIQMYWRPSRWLFGFGLFVILACAAPARAQPSGGQTVDGWDAAKWRFGPLAVTPKVELKNLGWDSNVFNETADPKSDFTATADAPIDWWLRFGRGRLHGVDVFEGVWFATYASQRGFNQRHDLTFLLPLNRIRPYVGGSYLSTNDRPGYEINARVRHTEEGGNGGVVVRVSNRLDVDVSGRATTYRYQDEADSGTNYAETLDRRTENYGAQFRYRLTPLTTLTLLADSVSERYTGAVERDNDGYRILPGVEFGEHALITGKAQVGYRKLNTLTPGMPDFSGLVASAELSYAYRGTTRFTAGVSRDIYFSYEITEPFYIQPGFSLSVTQQVTGPWDVQARGAWYRLNYQRADTPGAEPAPGRVDRYLTWGGGVGYRVGRDIRVGFNVDSSHRESIVQGQNFDGIRGGMAVTYVVK